MSRQTVNSFKRNLIYIAAAFFLAFGRAGSLKFYEAERVEVSAKWKLLFLIVRTVLYFALFLGIFAGIEKLLDRGLSRKAFSEENETNTGKWWTGSRTGLASAAPHQVSRGFVLGYLGHDLGIYGEYLQ